MYTHSYYEYVIFPSFNFEKNKFDLERERERAVMMYHLFCNNLNSNLFLFKRKVIINTSS